jgi:16S rRNA processing protein RimM
LSVGGRRVSVGRVGRAHGRDGSFYVERSEHELEVGTEVVVAGERRRVERRDGTGERPLVRLSGIADRGAAMELHGERLLVTESVYPLADDEWLAGELVGLRVEGLGAVQRVRETPSCAVLELDDGTLVPFVADAILAVDLARGSIQVDRAFLGLEDER